MLSESSRPLRWLAIVGLACVAITSGCVLSQTTDGQPIEEIPVSEIVVGKTTRADVTRLLGPPDEVIYSNQDHDPLFEQAYRYRRTKNKQSALFLVIFSTHRSDTQYDHVMVFFDRDGRVEHVGTRLDSDEASYGGPW